MTPDPGSRAAPPSLLDGASLARRPTHPITAIVLVPLCLVLGQTIGALALMPATGASAAAFVTGQLGLPEQLLLTLSFLGVLGLLAAWVCGKERRPFASLGFTRTAGIGRYFAWGAGAGLGLMTVPVVAAAVAGQFHLGLDPLAGHLTRLAGVLVALLGFAVQASTEEIATRGFLLQTTYRRWGLGVALGVQAVVFAVMHGVNAGLSTVALLNLLLVGVFFALWALLEGGLWGACALHAVWNWTQGNLYGIDVSGMQVRTTLLHAEPAAGGSTLLTGGSFGLEGSLITTVLLLGGIAVTGPAVRRRRAAVPAG